MKSLFAIFLCVLIVLTGCQDNQSSSKELSEEESVGQVHQLTDEMYLKQYELDGQSSFPESPQKRGDIFSAMASAANERAAKGILPNYYRNKAKAYAFCAGQYKNSNVQNSDYELLHVGNVEHGTIYNIWVESYDDFVKKITHLLRHENLYTYEGANYFNFTTQLQIYAELEQLGIKDICLSGLDKTLKSSSPDLNGLQFVSIRKWPQDHKTNLPVAAAKVYAATSEGITLHKNSTSEENEAFDKSVTALFSGELGVGHIDVLPILIAPARDQAMREMKSFLQKNPGKNIVMVSAKGHYWPSYFDEAFNPRVYSKRLGDYSEPKIIKPVEKLTIRLIDESELGQDN